MDSSWSDDFLPTGSSCVKSTSHICAGTQTTARRNSNSPVCVDAGLNATPDVEKAAVGGEMAATASMMEKIFMAGCCLFARNKIYVD
jgi:hypothetical protein